MRCSISGSASSWSTSCAPTPSQRGSVCGRCWRSRALSSTWWALSGLPTRTWQTSSGSSTPRELRRPGRRRTAACSQTACSAALSCCPTSRSPGSWSSSTWPSPCSVSCASSRVWPGQAITSTSSGPSATSDSWWKSTRSPCSPSPCLRPRSGTTGRYLFNLRCTLSLLRRLCRVGAGSVFISSTRSRTSPWAGTSAPGRRTRGT
mmetsp:Transcript_52091/g.153686  ORF Transcript_52091/g.153686 Transcript_52091/m.153686 type:complete len:205 (-) Transcript_52091:2561-3175(-)